MDALSIITPCSRPENLLRIWETIPKGSQWLVVLDRPNLDDAPAALVEAGVEFHWTRAVGNFGNPQRNLGLTLARRDYVYFLDDDNVIHPRLIALLEEHRRENKIIVVNQSWPDGRPRLKAAPPVRVGKIDPAQVLVPLEYAKLFSWKRTISFADGLYFRDLFRRYPDEFLFLDVDAAHYNYLRPV